MATLESSPLLYTALLKSKCHVSSKVQSLFVKSPFESACLDPLVLCCLVTKSSPFKAGLRKQRHIWGQGHLKSDGKRARSTKGDFMQHFTCRPECCRCWDHTYTRQHSNTHTDSPNEYTDTSSLEHTHTHTYPVHYTPMHRHTQGKHSKPTVWVLSLDCEPRFRQSL